jgi:hypothetical protein
VSAGGAGATELTLPLHRLRRRLAWTVGIVIYAGITVEFLQDVVGLGDLAGFRPFLSLSHESNLPTWLSACLLLACAVVLAAIAQDESRRRTRFARHWWLLSALFLYISLDETAGIHEQANQWFDLSGAFYFGWVIPAAILVGLLGIAYLRFLAALPPRSRRGFVVAGLFYVGGALGVELVLGWWTDRIGDQNFGYAAIDWVEESMEMIGVTLFLLCLLEHLGGASGELRVSLTPGAGSRAAESGSGAGGASAR